MSFPSVTTEPAKTKPAREPILSPKLVNTLWVAVVLSELVLLLFGADKKNVVWDELITYFVSTIRPFPVMWKALKAGIDGMTPAFYGVMVLVQKLPGNARIVLRLPSLFGYLLALVGVFWFVRKRLPPVAALCAVVLVSLSPFRWFATEARSYALLVGLLAVAAALWQRADEKWWAKPLLAACLASAAALHYTGVAGLLGFGLAELAYYWHSRRLRWSMWVIFAVAMLPVLFNVPFMLALKAVYGKHYWAKTAWGTALTTYGTIFEMSTYWGLLFVGVFLLGAGSLLLRLRSNPDQAFPEEGFPLPDILLIGGFLIFPAVLVALAKIGGSGYTDRYGKPAILALALGLIFLAGDFWKKRAASAVLALLLIVFAYQGLKDFKSIRYRHRPIPEERWAKITALSNADPSIPVVMDSVDLDLEMMYYPAGELRSRIVRLVDFDAAARLTDADTSEVIHSAFGKFLPWPVQDSSSFLLAHKKFFVQSDNPVYSWFLRYALEKKYDVKLLWFDGFHSISLVQQ